MPEITIDNQTLFYTYQKSRETQGRNMPDAVLLHGAGGSHLDWPPTLRRLSGAHVYALDLPGHGRSKPPGRERIEAYADAVARFLETVNVERGILIGHSMGGAIAQEVALRQPPALLGIVLLATGARLRVSDEIMRGLRDSQENTLDMLMGGYWGDDAPESIKELTRRRLQEIDDEVLYGDFLACDRFDRMDRVQEIGLPTLVISGTVDRMTPLKYGRYLAQKIPSARLKIVEGGSHMMALEKPQEVGEYVEEFITHVVDTGNS